MRVSRGPPPPHARRSAARDQPEQDPAGAAGSEQQVARPSSGLPVPGADDPFGRLWRAADLVREHRGDGHIAAWISDVDSTEITVLTELWWGIEPGSYVWTRGWDDDDVAAARARLAARGLLDGEGALTDVVARLGDRADELFALLQPISRSLVGKDGYPKAPNEMFA